jgi:maltose alpha-D-glucosyltransferase/alpha-amylase
MGTGDIEFLHPDNHKILAYLRSRGNERALVVANLSRFPQYVELDLAAHEGLVPTEIFSNVRFPTIGKQPYLLTLSPHTFFWFRLESISNDPASDRLGPLRLSVHESWRELLVPESEGDLTPLLVPVRQRPALVPQQVPGGEGGAHRRPPGPGQPGQRSGAGAAGNGLRRGRARGVFHPAGVPRGEDAERREQRSPHAVIARIESLPGPDGEGTGTALGTVFDGFATGEAAWSILEAVRGTSRPRGEHGRLVGPPGTGQRRHRRPGGAAGQRSPPAVRAPEIEQSNTVLFVGEKAVLKSYRQIEPGANSELEMGQYLSRHMESRLAPRLLGSLSYEQPDARRRWWP